MADNVTITAGSGLSIATDEIGGIHYHRVKLTAGPDGTATDVSSAAPLPVTPNTGATVDAVAGASDLGVPALFVRRDTIATLTPANGDYARASLSARGALYVHPDPKATIANAEYEAVAASQTNANLGATGATGDFLAQVTIFPATVSPGSVVIKDGATTVMTFAGGTNSVSTLHPFTIDVGAYSVSGAWNITTGANVSTFSTGDFT